MNDILCSLPWVHLATHPEGKATLCCISDHTNNMSAARSNNQVLNLNKHSVIEIVNSDYFKKTRLEMLQGIKPKACLRCYDEEASSGTSKRLLENSRFTIDGITSEDGSITPNLKFIELRLGNLCNVRCRTCNPSSSTQWIQEYKKIEHELNFVTKYNQPLDASWTQNDNFWNELLSHSKNLELIYINGGEPTLVEKHWNYLERLIDAGLNNKITLWYNINMTNLPDKLINIWKKFKKVIIHASIDDIGERNTYLRKGTKWSDVENNLLKLKSLNWIETHVTQTVSWMNIYYVDEFKKYFDELEINTHINLVYDPVFLSPKILPVSIKTELFEKLQNFDWLHQLIKDGEDIDKFQQGIRYNNWLDKSRNENFADYFKEWNVILKRGRDVA